MPYTVHIVLSILLSAVSLEVEFEITTIASKFEQISIADTDVSKYSSLEVGN